MNSEKESLTLEEKFILIESGKRFCIYTLFIGILRKIINMIFCKSTLALGIFLLFVSLHDEKGNFNNTRVLYFVIFLIVFVFYECLVFLLKNKTTVNFNTNAGITLSKNKQESK